MKKIIKTKNKENIVNGKKNNFKKLPLIIVIVGTILIVVGIGVYLLSNKGLPGSGFNIRINQTLDGSGKIICSVSNCTKCRGRNYCSKCKKGYKLINGKCEKLIKCYTFSGNNLKYRRTKSNRLESVTFNTSNSECLIQIGTSTEDECYKKGGFNNNMTCAKRSNECTCLY